jgi:hypothetical protein
MVAHRKGANLRRKDKLEKRIILLGVPGVFAVKLLAGKYKFSVNPVAVEGMTE